MVRGYELLAGVGTAGLANLKTGGTAIRVAGQTARLYDAAGNVANVAEGLGGVYDDGLTWSNAAQLAGGLAGLRGNFADYAVKVDPTKLGTLGGNISIVKGVHAYEVGAYDKLARRSVGDDFAIHHVGQGHAMAQVVPGYNYKLAPAIAVPRDTHYDIPNLKGQYTGTARELIARDIRNLRNYTDAPNASLKQLIQLNKKMYPNSF